MKTIIRAGMLFGIIACMTSRCFAIEDRLAQVYTEAIYQIYASANSNDTAYGVCMADLDNNGVPELILYQEEAGGIMMRGATVLYWDGDQVQRTAAVDMESAYSIGVFCDSYTGEECYLTNVDCLEWTQLGGQIDEMVLKTERLCFDGTNAWKETVADFSQYQGQFYSQQIYDAYQEMVARFHLSETARYQTLYDNVQMGYSPTYDDLVSFVTSYQYAGYSRETAGSDVQRFLELMGSRRDEAEASGLLSSFEDGYHEEDLYFYGADLYGVQGNAMGDFTGGILQKLDLEFTQIDSPEMDEIVASIIKELDSIMTPKFYDVGDEDMPAERIWQDGIRQVKLTDIVNEGWRFYGLSLYRTQELGKSEGAFSDWQSAYKAILYDPQRWINALDLPNGWIFELIDLDQNGIPELVCVSVRGARGISAEVTVFTFKDNTFVQIPVEDTCDFSGLGGLDEYTYLPTGEKQWLMNLGMFTSDSLVPGSYLESTGGQSGVARLTVNADCTAAYYYPIADSYRDFDTAAYHAGGIMGKPLWEEGCVTQEAYEKIRSFVSQYAAGAYIPSLYIANVGGNDVSAADIDAFLNTNVSAVQEQAIPADEDTVPEDRNDGAKMVGLWADLEGHRWQFQVDGSMGNAGEYYGCTYSMIDGRLTWSNAVSCNVSVDSDQGRVYFLADDGRVINTLYRIDEVFPASNVCSMDLGENPIGSIDELSVGNGFVFVGGWCFDPDHGGTALKVHIYIGGDASTGTFAGEYTADAVRADVDQVYGYGSAHGLCAIVETSMSGWQDVYVYGINEGPGSNVLIGYGTVNIR